MLREYPGHYRAKTTLAKDGSAEVFAAAERTSQRE
jgi:hypothetical protein